MPACRSSRLPPRVPASPRCGVQVERVRAELEVPLPQLSELPDAERLQVGAAWAAAGAAARLHAGRRAQPEHPRGCGSLRGPAVQCCPCQACSLIITHDRCCLHATFFPFQLDTARRKRLTELLGNHCKKTLAHITSHKARAGWGPCVAARARSVCARPCWPRPCPRGCVHRAWHRNAAQLAKSESTGCPALGGQCEQGKAPTQPLVLSPCCPLPRHCTAPPLCHVAAPAPAVVLAL